MATAAAPQMPRATGRLGCLLRRLAIFGTGALLVGVMGEGGARLLAPDQQRDSCAIPGKLGQFRPNCTSAPMKLAEGPWLTERTNECGYVGAASCRSRAPGQLRVAVVGASLSRGHFVPYAQSWAAVATKSLQSGCDRPVDFQNLALARATENGKPVWRRMTQNLPAAMALSPDALVTVMAPTDIGFYAPPQAGGANAGPGVGRQLAMARNEIISGSRAALLARDALNRDPAAYAAQFLQRGDVSDYLRVPLSAAWRYRLGVAHAAFADIAAAAAARGVPWVVVLTPAYGGAAVAGLPPRHGIDPWQLGRAMAADVRAQGGHFIDLTSAFAAAPQLASLYYIADGHPNARGSALIAQAVAGLLAVQAAPFATCRVPV
jgi:hypothetical protein